MKPEECGTGNDYSFGGILRTIRVRNQLTLRAMAQRVCLDAGNYSKIENSRLPPPRDKATILLLIRGLELQPHEETFLIMAALNHHIGAVKDRFK